MDDKHRDILRREWSNLRRNLEVTKLLPELVELLDTEDVEQVTVEATQPQMVDKLLTILLKKGPTAFDVFVKGLQKIRQSFLAAPLLQESGTNVVLASKKMSMTVWKTYCIEQRHNISLSKVVQIQWMIEVLKTIAEPRGLREVKLPQEVSCGHFLSENIFDY